MIERQAGRALLLTPQDELLLILTVEPKSKRAFWLTPGGGIEADESPITEFSSGICIAVIHRTDDKLVVCPAGRNYGNDQIMALVEFQERFFESIVIR